LKNENLLNKLSCDVLSGVGKQTAAHLLELRIKTVQDLLFHLPFRYQDRTRLSPIKNSRIGEHVVLQGKITSIVMPKWGRTRLLCRLEDSTGVLFLRFFYISAFMRRELQVGVSLQCFGEVRFGQLGLELIHPEYRRVTPSAPLSLEMTLTPIYHTKDGLSQNKLRQLTDQALAFLEHSDLQELLPQKGIEGYPTLKEALCYVHRPPKNAPVDLLLAGKHLTQKRLGFEELLTHRLSLLGIKKNYQKQPAIPLPFNGTLHNTFLNTLPFALTHAQKNVLDTITKDLSRSFPMLRLIQGDVGSGKTIVAALAILQVVHQGYQAALLAPTELLVEQHFKNFQCWFQSFHINVVMLSRQLQGIKRREILKAIADGEAHIIIGTHAILQKEVTFSKLACIVIDEQHRFGVEQRLTLHEKGVQHTAFPHQLMMTATPIPRTLAMSRYANVDYSVIDELPPGRTPIITRVIPNSRRPEVVLRLKEVSEQGQQIYWVCTLITESETLQCETAMNTVQELQTSLPHLSIAVLHGQMKANEKEAIMSAFKAGDIHILVATTVIEVGVDVPNASLMVIENAERLGLAQLHQLRGRVGRGHHHSHCLLLYQSPLSTLAKERLKVMRETSDGFQIAERDLELRGPGEIMGTKQTGAFEFRVANILQDQDLLPKVEQVATVILNDHPELIPLLIKRWLRENERYHQV